MKAYKNKPTVWIVFESTSASEEDDVSGYIIDCRVFSSEEKAKNYIENCKKHGYSGYRYAYMSKEIE